MLNEEFKNLWINSCPGKLVSLRVGSYEGTAFSLEIQVCQLVVEVESNV